MTGRAMGTVLRAAAQRAHGLRRVRRPATADAPAFDLSYLRTGPRGRTPVVVIPGGPGLSSTLPYNGFRRWAADLGIDLIMVEHRGVGLSRTSVDGADLPAEAIWVSAAVDDLAAVLAAERIDSAIVVGASYGSYLAAGFGVRHPQRVSAMVLDSPMLSTDDHLVERATVRELMTPSVPTPIGVAVADLVARGIDSDDLLFAARTVYESGGEALLQRFLDQLRDGTAGLTWKLLVGTLSREATSLNPLTCINEFDLVGNLAFRELHYGAPPDGLAFDPAMAYAALADRFPPFVGEPFDLRRAFGAFDWPTVVLSGRTDLRTVPAIARQVVDLLPNGVLVELDNGHSALEAHPLALLQVIQRVLAGVPQLAATGASDFDRLPRRGWAAQLPRLLSVLLRLEQRLPLRRVGRGSRRAVGHRRAPSR